MASTDSEFTALTRREIAASGLGSDPKVISAFESLQEAAFSSNPQAAAAAQDAADSAAGAAAAAQGVAVGAVADAAAALAAANAASTLAGTKVTKGSGPTWAAPSGTATRTALAAYSAPTVSNPPTQAEMQALANSVQALSQAVVALITDLRANEAVKP